MNQQAFYFVGTVPCSKSLIQRAWIVKSFHPYFMITGDNLSEDAKAIQQAIFQFQNHHKEIDCKQSATAFRLMALRVSRKPGLYCLSGDQQLLNRPHQELVHILSQLNVKSFFSHDKKLMIQSEGWSPQGDSLHISSKISSQFASSIFLNSLNFDRDLFIHIESCVSRSYLNMTLSFLRQLGCIIEEKDLEFYIPKKQSLSVKSYTVEPDMSCFFSLACIAALNGQAMLQNWISNSLQPDFVFPSILKDMGVIVEQKNSVLKIQSSYPLQPISIDLCSNPDLFPCLAVLCSFAKGVSFLKNIPQLQYKESNRLQLIVELLNQINRKTIVRDHGLEIYGDPCFGKEQIIEVNSGDDHRMAMAGAMLKYANFRVKINQPQCVKKSFPHFWSLLNTN